MEEFDDDFFQVDSLIIHDSKFDRVWSLLVGDFNLSEKSCSSNSIISPKIGAKMKKLLKIETTTKINDNQV